MFKENFIKICVDKGISPTTVCTQVGISKSNYSNWSDDTIPRKTTLLKIASYLNVTVDDLLADNTQKTPPASKELTEGEAKLLELFRAMPEDRQAAYLDLLAAALKIEQ